MTTAESTQQQENSSSGNNFFVSLLSRLAAIPVFIILHKWLPDPYWPIHLDRVLLFLATIAVVEAIFTMLKPLVLVGLFASVVWLSWGSFRGGYGFRTLYNDYRAMIYTMWNSPHPESIVFSKLAPFQRGREIRQAIDFDNPEVRTYALLAIKKHFSDANTDRRYRTEVQCMAVFKEIKNNWEYVSDPKSREYFARASETVKTVAGDCDDYSIFVAACIKAIGGTARIVHTVNHVYPELLIGNSNDMEAINYIVKRQLFSAESGGKQLAYHTDEHGQAWLNLDYTAAYPGGPFMNEEVLGVLNVE